MGLGSRDRAILRDKPCAAASTLFGAWVIAAREFEHRLASRDEPRKLRRRVDRLTAAAATRDEQGRRQPSARDAPALAPCLG